VTDEREPQQGAWDADDAEDNEQTTVARNPLLNPPPGEPRLGEAELSSIANSPKQPESLPAPRRSLYERLIEVGAIDADPEPNPALAAQGGSEDTSDAVTEERAYGDLTQPTRGFPRPASEFELAYMRAQSAAPGDPARASDPSRPSTIPLRDSEVELMGGEGSRASTIPLRDSEMEFVRRDSDGFISALAQDPDVDEPPVSARFRRPAELASAPTPPQPPLPLPSVVLSPQMSTRHDSTERISTAMPVTHPLANSVAPTSVAQRREDRKSSGLLFAAIAAALVGVGVAVVGYQLPSREPEQKVAVSAPVHNTRPPEPVQPVAPPAEVQPALPAQPKPVPSEPTAEDLARERRHRLRAEREAAAKAVAEQGESEASPSAAAATKPEQASGASDAKPAAAAAQPGAQPDKAQASEGGLPAQPTREQVVAAMNSVLPGLQECVGEKHGVADVTVTVRSAGFVSYAIVGGTFVGTPEGSCIAKVVRDAKFPEFTDPFIRVTYPFNL
jgi:hypothetical protein